MPGAKPKKRGGTNKIKPQKRFFKRRINPQLEGTWNWITSKLGDVLKDELASDDRKEFEKQKAIERGSYLPKNEKMPYPLLMATMKKKKEKKAKELQQLREADIVTHTKSTKLNEILQAKEQINQLRGNRRGDNLDFNLKPSVGKVVDGNALFLSKRDMKKVPITNKTPQSIKQPKTNKHKTKKNKNSFRKRRR